MNEKQLNSANIENLTLLWEVMEAMTCSFEDMGTFRTSVSWPNRCWPKAITSNDEASSVIHCCDMSVDDCIFPLWKQHDEQPAELERILMSDRFETVLEQTAMYLKLADYSLNEYTPHDLSPVRSEQEIQLWTDTAEKSFGYDIDISVIRNIVTHPDVKLFLHFIDSQAAATVMLFRTGKVAGVHQMGVLPEYRGQGLATKLMKSVISLCHESRARYITLQASIAGEGLYTKLGFKSQFRIKSFKQIPA